MKYKPIYYPESRFGGFTNVDGTIAFYSRLHALLDPAMVVVDIGCGRGAYGEDPYPFRRQLRILKGKCQKLVGIDLDPGASGNPYIDEFRLIQDDCWPVEDVSVDLCLSDNVVEHVADPNHFFGECARILKPGGFVCIRTPNVMSYIGLISRLVPNRRHTTVLKTAKDRVNEQDVFPTYYRCNTIPSLRRMLAKYGFDPLVYGYEAEPSYLSFSRLAYWLGVLHQRFAPNLLRVGIHAFGQKKPG